jgi:Sec-independent protein translocase protein TatA
MKKLGVCLLVCVFLFGIWVLPVMAADTSQEIEQLKDEVQRLLKRIEDLEKKQTETQTKTVETQKKVEEVAKNAEKVEKKTLKDRIELGGEARFRAMIENASTPLGFYGDTKPGTERHFRDESSFPTRIRLNAHAEVVQDWVDFYARLTMNKRWGAFDNSVSASSDPFNKPNSMEASLGHDITPRFERAYMTMKLPWIDGKWYIGRLPGEDGAPQRSQGYIFPRMFIDSEIDGTLLKVDAPKTALDDVEMPWTSTRLWGTRSEPGTAATLKQYEAKAMEKSGIVLGYLKYLENKLKSTDTLETTAADSDAFLAQAELKLGKDTAIIWDGLTMDSWHMPNNAGITDATGKSVLDVRANYLLTGVYADTQLLGFEVYGAYYYSDLDVGSFGFTPVGTSTAKNVGANDYTGHMWFGGFNTGDLLGARNQLTVEYADGSDNWINPFNYRGFRRKGTVEQAAPNYFFDPTGKGIAGFYPCNARIWDIYYDFYPWKKVRFRAGYIDQLYEKHSPAEGSSFAFLGTSNFRHDYWPYLEVNISF